MDKQLRRSRRNKMIAGVCGGFAEFFNIDPTIVRIIWAVFAISGAGLVAYIVAAIIMPEDIEGSFDSGRYQGSFEGDQSGSFYDKDSDEWRHQPKGDPERTRNVVGAILVIIGLLLFLKEVFNWLDFKVVFPFLLVVIGILIIYRGRRGNV
ncbi:MAG TPA: PspC domain-containing protein [Clostridiaceae bacterium]|nr:PspC domain-containing protein [Clostridiaceae bacterium]